MDDKATGCAFCGGALTQDHECSSFYIPFKCSQEPLLLYTQADLDAAVAARTREIAKLVGVFSLNGWWAKDAIQD